MKKVNTINKYIKDKYIKDKGKSNCISWKTTFDSSKVAYRLATDNEIEIKQTLASLRKIVRKEFGKKCKERSPLCRRCIAYQCVEDLQELLA